MFMVRAKIYTYFLCTNNFRIYILVGIVNVDWLEVHGYRLIIVESTSLEREPRGNRRVSRFVNDNNDKKNC